MYEIEVKGNVAVITLMDNSFASFARATADLEKQLGDKSIINIFTINDEENLRIIIIYE